jgi:hypothetical protein
MLVFFAVICGGWAALSFGLGKGQEKRARESSATK